MSTLKQTITDKAINRFTLFSDVLTLLNKSDSTIETIVSSIIAHIERNIPHLLCSVLVLDETKTRLHILEAPNLPNFYNKAIDGIMIGEGIGSCGTSAATGKRVIIEDDVENSVKIS